jgi:hypothetical protein
VAIRRTALADRAVLALGSDALTWEELAARLAIDGGPACTADEVHRDLRDDPCIDEVGDRVVHVPKLFEGTTWTVWVDADEAGEGFLRTTRQLDPMAWWLTGDDVRVVDATGAPLGVLTTKEVALDDPVTGAIVSADVAYGPDGWLDEVAGGWASVDIVGGALRVRPCSVPPSATPRQIAALRRGFEVVVSPASRVHEVPPPDERFCTSGQPWLGALVEDREAFTADPCPPQPDLYREAGLEIDGALVAEAGFDWDALHRWQDDNRRRFSYGFDDRRLEWLRAISGACSLFLAEGPSALGQDEEERYRTAALLAAILEHQDLALAFWRECEISLLDPEEVGGFAEHLAERLADAPIPGLTWLRALCRDRSGDTRGAVALVDEVDLAATDHAPLLVLAAGFAADRGEAMGAYRLLGRVDIDTDGDDLARPFGFRAWYREAARLLDEVAEFALHRPPPAARRNDPCPCGSGRKYKACHLGQERHALANRAVWLHLKMCRFLRQRHQDLVDELTDAMTEFSPDLYDDLADSPPVSDLALQDAEVVTEFLSERAFLLPDDEALMAAQWALVEWSLFEVLGLGSDSLRVRDVRTGDRMTVVNVTPSGGSREGTLLLGRVHPVGDTFRALSGFIPMGSGWVDSVLAALDERDPFAVAEVIARRLAPPRMTNTDGDDLEFHTLRWRVGDVTALDRHLADAGLEGSLESGWVLSRDGRLGGSTVLANLRVDDGDLVAEVNSDQRAELVTELVASAVPGAELTSHDVGSLDDVMQRHPLGERPLASGVPDDPAIQEALRAMVRGWEESWIGESIPALGGRTPREAVADPVGREEVRRLLTSFPPASDALQMDPERLRDLLGL